MHGLHRQYLKKHMMDIKISPNMRMPILINPHVPHVPRCSTPDSGFLRARSLARGSVFMSLCADTLPSPADDSILGQHKTDCLENRFGSCRRIITLLFFLIAKRNGLFIDDLPTKYNWLCSMRLC